MLHLVPQQAEISVTVTKGKQHQTGVSSVKSQAGTLDFTKHQCQVLSQGQKLLSARAIAL